ncbi:tetratricopeptide repeat protein [Pseudomonas sp. BIGb0164]|uniref:tetratricopeptide repeat protein n=1 Tax=Pseudomonas sp. BIGb0164 TaxID=2940605 RepID=UPI002169F14F|nr:tetratricopeptide repeat protein [Pseudomonas sp. BIGb0164]MCS4249991.1 tetratricopeptide (TPR) repeat protein [Pseudomonas sp. BIGb0164]
MSTELDSALHEQIKHHSRVGDALAEQGKYEAAIAEYNAAWQLVPEPKNDWQASTWILAAIADACFLSGYKGSARDALQYAMTCPGAIGNPFLHLRLGQVYLDEGQEDRAADELMRAYMGAGADIFANESPHYLSFLKARATL